MRNLLIKISKEIKAQFGMGYTSTYGPGYSSPYSDTGMEGSMTGDVMMAKGPMGPNMDTDIAYRVQPYSRINEEMRSEWGEDTGNRPNGVETVVVEKRCKNCHGNGCIKCKNRGYIRKTIQRTLTTPKLDGRMRNQQRYREDHAWPHNRDYEDPFQRSYTWDELMHDKEMLGKPSLW